MLIKSFMGSFFNRGYVCLHKCRGSGLCFFVCVAFFRDRNNEPKDSMVGREFLY
jgi:hypothetical protein